jgi:hypothetical protein
LLVIPKTLAVNAAQDATDLIAKLCSYHHASQTDEEKADLRFCGLDLINGKVSYIANFRWLRVAVCFSTELAMILRIFRLVFSRPNNLFVVDERNFAYADANPLNVCVAFRAASSQATDVQKLILHYGCPHLQFTANRGE